MKSNDVKQKIATALALLLCGGLLAACTAQSSPARQPARSDEAGAPAVPDASPPASTATGDEAEGISTQGDPEKKVVLVVSFGTSYNDTRAVTIEAIEQEIDEAFPDYEMRRAFTSQTIIDKLAERDGLVVDNVDEAMQRLVADGVGTLVVQPTHVMNGSEYDDMVAEIQPYAERFARLEIGAPLLSSSADYYDVAAALFAEYAPSEDTALVLMGHGSHHFANSAYAALDYLFKATGHANVFVGTVEGFPELDTVLAQVDAGGYRKVVLAPLMVVAGDHAANDMAGDEEDSWKIVFKSQGYEVQTELKGMGEIPGIRAIYVDHAQNAIGEGETAK